MFGADMGNFVGDSGYADVADEVGLVLVGEGFESKTLGLRKKKSGEDAREHN
jgi:hypothetical protein